MTVPLSFGWRDVLFSNWPASSDRLSSHLPDQLEVDEFDSTGWLSVVAFRTIHTRPRGFPRALGMSFPQLDFRTYVTCDGEPGIYLFSLDAPSVLSVIGGRLFHRLPYYNADMEFLESRGTLRLESRRGHPGARPAWLSATYEPLGEWFTPEPRSLSEFLTERRRIYTQGQNGTVRFTDVRHERWDLSPVAVIMGASSLFQANGFDVPDTKPVHYYSPGVDVVTDWNRVWRTIG
jgi:uncharacterized protein YqjF (DUF2071 family)